MNKDELFDELDADETPTPGRPIFIRPRYTHDGRVLLGYMVMRVGAGPALVDEDILAHYNDPNTPGRDIKEDFSDYDVLWGDCVYAPEYVKPPEVIRTITPRAFNCGPPRRWSTEYDQYQELALDERKQAAAHAAYMAKRNKETT